MSTVLGTCSYNPTLPASGQILVRILLKSCLILNKTQNTFIAITTCWFEQHKNIQNSQELGREGEGEGQREGEEVTLLTFPIDCLPE